MRLEEITPSARLSGILPGRPITVLGTQFHGADAVTVTYEDDNGSLGRVVLYRSNEDEISPHLEAGRPFDADPRDFKIAAEAQRILLAGTHDPMLAVTTSDVQPLPHQIRAVYGELLPRTPLRFLLADDPGAGKTIMAGLYVKELILRDDVRQCLIVAPGGLVEQWQDELKLKFGLDFEILQSGVDHVAPGSTVFDQKPLLIARMDQVARSEALLDQLSRTEFDLVIVDEAHRMSASWFSGELKASKRFQLGELLSERARHFLLMTATPHNGKEEDFQTFLSLLDRDRFVGPGDKHAKQGTVDGIMRRMVKEDLLTFEGRRLFPERRSETVSYRLSDEEQHLYELVTEYVREGMNRADRLDGQRKNTVGFALTVLQRRLASSPEAIYQSLRRRADRLERLKADLADGVRDQSEPLAPAVLLDEDGDIDDLDAAELEAAEEELVDAATAAMTIAELETEIAELKSLTEVALRLLASEQDIKWRNLQGVLQSQVLERRDGGTKKIIVFTEHRDTLNYLERRIIRETGNADAVVTIHGAVPRWERRRITQEFTSNPDVQVLIATDAAGEGLNLQVAHLMVNYDLPWNPNRIEQRFGRIHRIGQTEVCFLWNLVAEDTREGDVFRRLLDKIAEQETAYGGKIYNVLGTSLGGLNLTKVIKDAIRYGEDPARVAERDQIIDQGVADGIQEFLEEDALATDSLATADLNELRRQMEDAKARRLQPHFIRDAFKAAFEKVGGSLERRERGRFEIPHVPAALRERVAYAPIARKYSRVTFDLESVEPDGLDRAELLAPGHPLHDAVLQMVVDLYGSALDRGAVLSSPTVTEPTLLVGVLNEVRDSTGASVGERFGYATITATGEAHEAGPAPYLDFASPTTEQLSSGRALEWLTGRERDAVSWVIAEQLPEFAKETTARRTREFERIRDRVDERLKREINRLETQALKADADASSGKKVRYSSDHLRKTADELAARRESRLAHIERQLRMAPIAPQITAIALIMPAAPDASAGHSVDAAAQQEVDRRGVALVLASERSLGREPEEEAHNNPGFDIRSVDSDGNTTWIEVKSRIDFRSDFSISRNQVLKSLNVREQFRLALVRVSTEGPEKDEVRYIADPFQGMEPASIESFYVESLTLNFDEWWGRGREPF